MPTKDTTQDITVKGYEIGDNSYKVKFTRKLVTGDGNSQDTDLASGTLTWAYA